jgi:hypothetical protein
MTADSQVELEQENPLIALEANLADTVDKLLLPDLSLPQAVDPQRIDKSSLYSPQKLTPLDAFTMCVALAGLKLEGKDVYPGAATIPLGFASGQTGEAYTQTCSTAKISTPFTPFTLTLLDNSRGQLSFSRPGNRHDKQSWPVRVDSLKPITDQFYFPLKGVDGKDLPYHINIDPRRTCTERCPTCPRTTGQYTAAKAHQEADYIEHHLELVDTYFTEQALAKSDLLHVNIVTGCQPTPQAEAKMFSDIMAGYREKGFAPSNFGFLSYQIDDPETMRMLKDGGLAVFNSTLETISDKSRQQSWGGRKARKTYDQHRATLAQAVKVFPVVEVNLVLGMDPYNDFVRGAQELGSLGVNFNANVPRIYDPQMLNNLHPEFLADPIGYLTKAFELIFALHRENIKKGRPPGAQYIDAMINEHQQQFPPKKYPLIYHTPRKYRV